MKEHHEDRLTRLQATLERAGIGWLWVEPSVTYRYLTGLAPLSMERPMCLLVSATGELRSMVPELLHDEIVGLPVEPIVWTDDEGPEDAISAVLKGIVTLHVQAGLPFGVVDLLQDAGGVKVSLEPGEVARLRAHKDEAEIESLRGAGRAADEVVSWAAAQIGDPSTETLLSSRMQAEYLSRGFQPWPALVAVGANAALPHHAGGGTVVDGTQPTLLDTGCSFEGYWSDITRMVFPEKVDTAVEDAYSLVQDAYENAFTTVAPGVPCEEVDRAARSVIEEAGFGDRFIHRTGHGVGLELHEAPYIREGNAEPLEVGHVFTIEPGIYLPGEFGVRFENTVVVTESGAEPLNAAAPVLRFGA